MYICLYFQVQINIYWPQSDDETKEKVFVFESPPDARGHRHPIAQFRVKLVNEVGDQTYTRREMLLIKEDKDGRV